MTIPSADTPLYNHPLPDIEHWLRDQGCQQDPQQLHQWSIQREAWHADIILETDAVVVRYRQPDGNDENTQRIFKYSLSRQDLEEAIFSGP